MSILDVKLRNVGSHLRAAVSPNSLAAMYQTWSKSYLQRYFGKNSSARPVFQVIFAVGLLGYVLEYSHIKKEANAKYH